MAALYLDTGVEMLWPLLSPHASSQGECLLLPSQGISSGSPGCSDTFNTPFPPKLSTGSCPSLWGLHSLKTHYATRRKDPGSISGVAGKLASDSSMFPGFNSASKTVYEVNPGGKSGRCVMLTTYHFMCRCKKFWVLNPLETCGPVRPVMGQLYQLYSLKTNRGADESH
jgi:hypothetical protein